MRLVPVFFLFVTLCLPAWLHAQSGKNSAGRKNPTSLDPAPEEIKSAATSNTKRSRRSQGPVIETQEEYVARMKRTAKQIRKREKEMKKPQYSDPMYFGHKRPPKKNKAGHLKFCKECGMRH